MRVRHFHPVDLDENKIIQLLRLYTGLELCDYFADRRRLACAGRAGDIDACARAGGNGSFEVCVNGGEFNIAARKAERHRGDV